MAETYPPCSREDYFDTTCAGEVFERTSRSGITSAWICERHAYELDAVLDGIAVRYPEVNHPEGCSCWGCSDGSY